METFDLGVGFPAIDAGNDFFVDCLRRECASRGMRFIFVDARSLERLTGEIANGNFKLQFYLDMTSETFDPRDAFLKFTYALKEAGTRIVADPDDVKISADKAVTHFNLFRAGVPVPFTVLINSLEPARQLTDEESERLGNFFVIKPALGYGERGVKVVARGTMFGAIAESRKANMGDMFLAQEFIEPKVINGEPAWFRLFHTFGEITPSWWNNTAHTYRHVTMEEMSEHKLLPMAHVALEIARITRIEWFSCEIAQSKKNNEFVAIDYVNDQCWVNPKSKSKDGIPDDIIAHLAGRIVENARNYIEGHPAPTQRAIWFPNIKEEFKGPGEVDKPRFRAEIIG